MIMSDYTVKFKSICDSLGSINITLTKTRWYKYAWATSHNGSTR